MDTINLKTANLRQIATFFGVSQEIAKAIDNAKPKSSSELMSVPGFPEDFDGSDKEMYYHSDKPMDSQSSHANPHKSQSGVAQGQGPPPAISSARASSVTETGILATPQGLMETQTKLMSDMQADFVKTLQEMQDKQAHQNKEFEQLMGKSRTEMEVLKSKLSDMSQNVSNSCDAIAASVVNLKNSVSSDHKSQSVDDTTVDLDPSVSNNIKTEPPQSRERQSFQSFTKRMDTLATEGVYTGRKLPRVPPRSTANENQVSSEMKYHNQGPPNFRSDIDNDVCSELGKPPSLTGFPLGSNNQLDNSVGVNNVSKNIKLPKFQGTISGITWEAFISVLESRANRSNCSETVKLELLEGSLDSEAFQFYGTLPSRENRSYSELKAELENRFGRRITSKARRWELHAMCQESDEDLCKYSARVSKVACEGYPDLPSSSRAELEQV